MTPRALALLAAGGFLAAWFAAIAGTATAPPSAPSTRAEAPGLDPVTRDIQAQAKRLHDRLTSIPAFGPPTRNPFRFAPAAVPVARARRVVASPVPAALPLPPLFKLVGIAEDPAPHGPERTAVLSGTLELLLVKEGDRVGGRYRVVRIGADAVELVDLVDDSVIRLALR